MLEEIRRTTRKIALELGVIGLINVQYAVAEGELFVIEANPRASRTSPCQQGDRRAAGEDRLPADARRVALGPGLPSEAPTHVSVKEAVLPFARFAGADAVLGPEMRSTGEVMGIAS